MQLGSRLNTLLLMFLLLTTTSIIGLLAGRAWGGPLDPPGTPGPTLAQVEPRSPIPPVGWNGTFPIVIGQPGSYYFTRDIQQGTGNVGISITANMVTLDLNGFALRGRGGNGIEVADQTDSVSIRNGTITGWYTGIAAGGSDRARIEDLAVTDNQVDGIVIGSGSLVARVRSENNLNVGLAINDLRSRYYGGIIEDSVFTRNGNANVLVAANNVTVRRNVIDSVVFRESLVVSGSFDVVTDNTIQGSQFSWCVLITGNVNTLARNVIVNCASGGPRDNGLGNQIGPATSDLKSTQPWSNVEF